MKKITWFYFIFIGLCFVNSVYLHGKILAYYYTDSHKKMVNTFFLPSLKEVEPDLVTVSKRVEQECPSGAFQSKGWQAVTRRKIEILLELTKQHPGETIIYSDVDIIFAKPFVRYVEGVLANKDLLLQQAVNCLCSGFMVFRANESVEQLWQQTIDLMNTDDFKGDDQDALNVVLLRNRHQVRWGMLPRNKFYLYGWASGGNVWRPGMRFKVPDEVIMFHASYTIGVSNKEKLLRYVQEQVGC